ncbi:M48 family metalloprotease [Spirillospora sp. CA-142024]|uniref:M48 family metalloprotease n=1 Tax=Spirillospora sp. CA-142024 TaxID=3240036 RepID=UPI003D916306
MPAVPAPGMAPVPVPGAEVGPASAPPGAPARYLPPGRSQEASGQAGLVVGLVAASEGVLVAAAAFGAHLVWPVWGAVAAVAVWAVLLSAPLTARRAYGYREPDTTERVRLGQSWRDVQYRAGAGAYRLVVVESDELNACRPFGRTVAVTSRSARSLPPGHLEAVLAHELGHLLGWRAVPAFVHAQLTLPSRALLWTLRRPWSPIVPMWKKAVEWHRPIGFLPVLLLAVLATAVTVVVAVPAAVAYAAAASTRLLSAHGEARADAAAVRMGLGAELVAAVEHRIEHQPHGLPLPLVRRAQALRRRLG